MSTDATQATSPVGAGPPGRVDSSGRGDVSRPADVSEIASAYADIRDRRVCFANHVNDYRRFLEPVAGS
jgi:hypothetical protein